VPTHPPLKPGVHLRTNEKHEDCPDRLAQPEDDGLDGGFDFRGQEQEKLDGKREDDRGRDGVEEECDEVADTSRGLETELQNYPRRNADPDPLSRTESWSES